LDTAALLRFLRDAHRRGYATGQNALTVREADHSTTIAYESGEWRFHDNYFGGEPFGGRAVAFLSGRPVWIAVYYGRVEDPGAEVQPVYSFLQRALLRARTPFPSVAPRLSPTSLSPTATHAMAKWRTSGVKRSLTVAVVRCMSHSTLAASSTCGTATERSGGSRRRLRGVAP
jgi:hypothetical protein